MKGKDYTLILDKSFRPLDVVDVKKCMSIFCNDEIKALDTESYNLYDFDEWLEYHHNKRLEYHMRMTSSKYVIPIPEIAVRVRAKASSKEIKSFSRSMVFVRDNFTCVYCDAKLNDSKSLTIDHVHSKSSGGKLSYDNTVTACKPCNIKKGSMTLSEFEKIANKKFHLNLNEPTCRQYITRYVPQNKIKDSWATFIKG